MCPSSFRLILLCFTSPWVVPLIVSRRWLHVCSEDVLCNPYHKSTFVITKIVCIPVNNNILIFQKRPWKAEQISKGDLYSQILNCVGGQPLNCQQSTWSLKISAKSTWPEITYYIWFVQRSNVRCSSWWLCYCGVYWFVSVSSRCF